MNYVWIQSDGCLGAGTKMLLLASLLAIFAIYVTAKRLSIYPYDVDADYAYSFAYAGARVHDLVLRDGRITLPVEEKAHLSAFVKLRIETTLLGSLFMPSVTMKRGDEAYVQYFERGTSGTRYLNITPLLSDHEEQPVEIIGDMALVDDQLAQLILVRNGEREGARMMVVAPHPDDAEIAAFGLYSSTPGAFVITVTAGEAGCYKYDELYENKAKQYLKKGILRTWNSITVPLLGGVPPERAINLGFFNSTLEEMYTDKDASVKSIYIGTDDVNTFREINVSTLASRLRSGSSWNSLVDSMKLLLGSIRPDVIVAPYPALDSHMDHKLTTVALFEAITKLGMTEGKLYLYTNHLELNDYYPYGKEGGVVSLPPDFHDSVYFEGIYSHTLSPDKQKDKLLALEAMNDLRPDTEWRFIGGALKQVFQNVKHYVLGTGNSYFRRAVRSNELFFVVDISSIYDEKILKLLYGRLPAGSQDFNPEEDDTRRAHGGGAYIGNNSRGHACRSKEVLLSNVLGNGPAYDG